MESLPSKPAGSVIEESADSDSVTLSWPRPSIGPSRYAMAAFLAFWLCGWAAGWVSAAAQIVRGDFHLFLVAWLGGWTVGSLDPLSAAPPPSLRGSRVAEPLPCESSPPDRTGR